jgi:hypothetical protein
LFLSGLLEMARRADALEVVEIRSISAVEQGLDVIDLDSGRLPSANAAVLAQRRTLENLSPYRCPS